MKFIVLTLALVCLAQDVFGAPKQASTAEVDTSNIEALFNNFNTFIKDGASKILGDDAIKHMQENTNLVVGGFNKMLNEIGEQSKNYDVEAQKVFQQFEAKLKENMDAMRKEHPEGVATAEKMKETLEKAMKNVMQETKNLEKSMTENSKGLIQDAQKMAKETFEKLMAASKEIQSKYLEPKSP